MRNRRTRLLAAVLAAVLLPTAAVAAPDVDEAERKVRQLEQEAERQRDQVSELQHRQATVEERLEAARAELDRLQPKLDAASVALSEAEERAAQAARDAELARARAERLEERLEAALERLQENEDERGRVARNAYKHGPGIASPSMAALEMTTVGSSPTDVADTIHMLDVLLVDHGLLVEESVELAEEAHQLAQEARAAQKEREEQAEQAEAAKAEAAERHSEMLHLLSQAEEAEQAQRAALAQVESSESQARQRLQELEQAKANAKTQAERARAEAARQAELRRQREAAARRAAEEQASSSGGGAVGMRNVFGEMVSVDGITVHQSIAGNLRSLLQDARKAGIVLGGHGYRSPETTARLRRANGCPDVYDSPASSCRVPTARPGTSMHEKGLAVDFTWNGSTICYPNPPSRCHGNRAFDWLNANASKYGLHGLSSEAWHYSTNGN